MRVLAFLIASTVVLAACGETHASPVIDVAAKVEASALPTEAPALTTPAPTATPDLRLYDKLRVFVASESTDQVWVLEGTPSGKYGLVAKIPVGRLPHQIAVSPDGKYVAVNNRMANSTSIIDPIEMKELKRITVGKQPHGITFSADGHNLFVAHERDNYIAKIDTTTWTSTALMTGVPQHVLTINPMKTSELWFTVTNSTEGDVLRVLDLGTRQITKVKVGDVHDAYFTPDGTELWSSSSGFLDKPSDRVVIYDPVARAVKKEIRFAGRYPFHTFKPLQDGMYRFDSGGIMVFSDHIGPSLIWVDWRERAVVAETKLGQQPFHSTYDPEGGRLLVTTNVDGQVNVIDVKTRQVVQKVPVTRAHGIVSVGIRAAQ